MLYKNPLCQYPAIHNPPQKLRVSHCNLDDGRPTVCHPKPLYELLGYNSCMVHQRISVIKIYLSILVEVTKFTSSCSRLEIKGSGLQQAKQFQMKLNESLE